MPRRRSLVGSQEVLFSGSLSNSHDASQLDLACYRDKTSKYRKGRFPLIRQCADNFLDIETPDRVVSLICNEVA